MKIHRLQKGFSANHQGFQGGSLFLCYGLPHFRCPQRGYHCFKSFKKRDDDKLDWIRKNREMAGARSNSEFVNRAVEFYVGYLNSEQSQDYLIKTVSSMMDAKLDLTKNRTDGMIFKLAVEVAMQNRILAKTVKIGEDEIKKIRDKALDDVRKIWY